MKYYLITSTEDGLSIREGTAEQVKKAIAETEYYFLDKFPGISRGQFWNVGENAALLIKGQIVVPQAKAVVTEYDL